mmetsp:Transcript_1297/g.2814  ORF Transcript_1297/g.2814 Transcript_1297/m.2814 type:complete len:376 (+) Transcript_1297:199-1326(+)
MDGIKRTHTCIHIEGTVEDTTMKLIQSSDEEFVDSFLLKEKSIQDPINFGLGSSDSIPFVTISSYSSLNGSLINEKIDSGTNSNRDDDYRIQRSFPNEQDERELECNTSNDENDELRKHLSMFMKSRMMTPQQERLNALTMVPNPLYCLYFILSGGWMLRFAMDARIQSETSQFLPTGFDPSVCIQSEWFPNMHLLPPKTVMAIALGYLVHAPFSFVYHWKYCTSLKDGFDRVNHLSRRLDSAFIHVCCAIHSYGLSGSVTYFIISCFINAYFFLMHFENKIIPKRNQAGMACGILTCALPVFLHSSSDSCIKFATASVLSIWSFVKYPFGGWSHSLGFHVGLLVLSPIFMEVACGFELSREQILVAAKCASLRF